MLYIYTLTKEYYDDSYRSVCDRCDYGRLSLTVYSITYWYQSQLLVKSQLCLIHKFFQRHVKLENFLHNVAYQKHNLSEPKQTAPGN